MKIYDISQPVFGCKVYSGDPAPQKKVICSIESGDLYNLTEFSMCAHNGTHIDAPAHFLKGGKTVDEIPLEKTVGYCFVCEFNGYLLDTHAKSILQHINKISKNGASRLLFKGETIITEQSASFFASQNIMLIGVESQSVGDENAPKKVHEILLEKGVVLLEGLVLENVLEGEYFLCAQSLNLNGVEGAPCRAILIEN